MVSISGGAWSKISRGAAVKHFVVAAMWYFLRGAALQHLSSGGLLWHFLWRLFRHNMAPSGELLHSIFEGLHLLHILRRPSLRHFLGGAALWHFLVVDASRHFLEGGLLCDIFEGGLERPLCSLHIKTITEYVACFYFSESTFRSTGYLWPTKNTLGSVAC